MTIYSAADRFFTAHWTPHTLYNLDLVIQKKMFIQTWKYFQNSFQKRPDNVIENFEFILENVNLIFKNWAFGPFPKNFEEKIALGKKLS